ncbi:hypothetical protein [Metabacillus indicus]|uniref:hypothetical protein n=1 Tax=Metabacillus indicus TaxID=246786 RepID=UPI0004932689|nr:hypothetical protein [Metabacillus indicus]KEZ49536.1 hypothetical protein AZ46_0213505 [Metabacillus indicus LMG 22858]
MARCGLILLVMVFILLLAGCQQESKEDAVRILIFSDIHPAYQEEVEKELQQRAADSPLNVELHPLSKEKFAVLLAQQDGDLYMADTEYVKSLAGKSGLESLGKLAGASDVEEYRNGQEHFGASLPSGLIPYNQNQQTLAAFVPSFSDQKENSMEVLGKLLNRRNR